MSGGRPQEVSEKFSAKATSLVGGIVRRQRGEWPEKGIGRKSFRGERGESFG